MIDPKLVDVFPTEHTGYPDSLAQEDTPDVLFDVCGNASRKFPDSMWIEPRDWADASADNDRNNTWPINYIDRYTNQGSPPKNTHECTCHSYSRVAEGARNKQIGVSFPDGPKKGHRYEESSQYGSVWLSPLSVYAEANPREWGGANVRQVMEIAAKRGTLPEPLQPAEYSLPHTLHGTVGKGGYNQSRGSWVPLSQFPSGWEETAAWFKPLECVFPESWEQAVCLILHGHLVGVGRNGHAVPWAKWHHSEQKMSYPDSYEITRYDSLSTVKRAYRGSFAILTMSAPDDWKKPAGE